MTLTKKLFEVRLETKDFYGRCHQGVKASDFNLRTLCSTD